MLTPLARGAVSLVLVHSLALAGCSVGGIPSDGPLIGQVMSVPRGAGRGESQYPVARRTPRAGYVYSPFAADRVLDVRGVPAGALCRDPAAGALFTVPPPETSDYSWVLPALILGAVVVAAVSGDSSPSGSSSAPARSDEDERRARDDRDRQIALDLNQRQREENRRAYDAGQPEPHPAAGRN